MLCFSGGKMYAETGLLCPYYQSFSQEIQQLEEFCKSQKSNASMSNLLATSSIYEYDLGGEGDLFKAPEPIIEESTMGLDPMTVAISMISCGEDVISPQGLEVSDIESFQSEPLLSEFFYDCKKDLLEKAAMETQLSEIRDIKMPVERTDESQIEENKLLLDSLLQKSVSSGCLTTMDWISGVTVKPSFLDFPGMDFGAVYGLRKSYSDGDIKTLGNGNVSLIPSSFEQPLIISNCSTEERREKLSRYRNKKTKRNFGRRIKYACRKALADSQPRIRGRFAKTEESEVSKRQ